MPNSFFIEIDSFSLCEEGNTVSGNVCMQRRKEGRSVVVLANGAGSGVRANVVAKVIASMAMNYTFANESIARAARTIIQTFSPGTDDSHNAAFIILDVNKGGLVQISEFDNPQYILLRVGKDESHACVESMINNTQLLTSDFEAMPEDRIIIFNEGIEHSGRMTKRLPKGWGREGIIDYCIDMISGYATVSAKELCRKIVERAEMNDLYAPKSDMTCAVVYFRQPRRIMVLSGPPYNENKDVILADMINKYDGTKLICGGTTAQIVARELGREVEVNLKRDPAGLPPTSTMQGIDLVTEGVLTLSKVKRLLDDAEDNDIKQLGTDGVVARMLLEHDIIDFVVGTRINPRHQDPELPIDLELRRNLIRDLAAILENKYMKEVRIQYI